MKLFLIEPTILIKEPDAINHILIFAVNELNAIQNTISKNIFGERSNNLFIREIDTDKTEIIDISSNNLVFKNEKRQYVNGEPNIKQIKVWLKSGNNISEVIEVNKNLEFDEINKIAKEKALSMLNFDWREL